MNIPVQKDQLIFGTSFALLFILWNYLFIGIKMDLVIFALTIGSGAILSRTFFKFILAFSAFIIFLIIYDGLQIFHNYELNSVSIAELYNLEKSLFGFMYNGEKIIPCEYFLENQMPLLSFFLGFSYLMWMPAPFIFTGYMYWVDKSLMLRYSYAFLFVNLLGFIGYYVYPAAPPWYYFKYGAEFITGLNGDAGLLVNFDKIVGFPVFESIYNRGSNVFCAIPSLHCAFMVINIYYAYQLKSKSMKS